MHLPAKNALRSVKYFVLDHWEVVSGKRDSLTPPARFQNFVGIAGLHRQVGQEFVDYFVRLCGLRPMHHVLDVGSGFGRMAAPLTRVIDKCGSYNGVEIFRPAVEWCDRHIHRRFSNFRFHHADVWNSAYNPKGKVLARNDTFPFPNALHDFVFLTSVFTHMLPPDVERYLAEIARVLKPGARGLLTFFLLDDESLALVASGLVELPFVKYDDEIYVTNPQILEAAVGYPESRVRKSLAEHGLSILEPIHYGNWCGRDRHLSYQDIIVIEKN
jgi:SAM-dependent methyltransferase